MYFKYDSAFKEARGFFHGAGNFVKTLLHSVVRYKIVPEVSKQVILIKST